MKSHTLSKAGWYLAAFLLILTFGTAIAGEVTFNRETQTDNYQVYSFFSATTTSATSTNLTGGGGYLTIAGAKAVTFYFSRGGATGPNSGSTRFEVEVTPDGTNWYDFNQLQENAATTTKTYYETYTLAGTTTAVTSMSLVDHTFLGARCIAIETTDGDHTCSAAVTF